ncbi:MAG: methionyl-tRNA formyltransferase [Actinomycetota bacterium]
MSQLRVGWVGFHEEGVPALRALIERGCLVGAMTLEPDAAAKRSAVAGVAEICRAAAIDVTEVAHVNDEESIETLRGWRADVIFVIGWSQILSEEALSCASIGTIGAHASLLPRLRGSAPVNWAIIRGETSSGNSLMWLDAEVDNGDLVDQRAFPITDYDTCATVYDKVAATNREMIVATLDALEAGTRPRRPQGETDEPLLPRRRPADGDVDWSAAAVDVHRFVRALTRPYPGAFSALDGRRATIWRSVELDGWTTTEPPGTVVGALRSPDRDACGIVVACGTGAIGLLEIETDDETLAGPELADQPWRGRRFGE